MTTTSSLARVILRSDGSVHIAFRDVRSIYATAENIMELFSDPIDFINAKSLTYKESTFEINRKRLSLEDILGLTLATVNSDKQIICEFPELFRHIVLNTDTDLERHRPLNMKSYELETVLSDEKSYLLRYYLEFTNHINSSLVIKNNIKLRDEIQFQILREILNAFFSEELPAAQKQADVSAKINEAENENILQNTSGKRMVGAIEYSNIIGTTPHTVRRYIAEGRLKSAIKDEKGHLLIDPDDRPIDWDKRKGRKRKPNGEEKNYKRKHYGSAADVEEHIKKTGLFSDVVAPFIHTFEELDYYTKRNYKEVDWNGNHFLIIDVNPDYISSATGESNRELMAKGEAPVVPDRNKEEFEFHLHHIGQHSKSPLAIIPKYDHNSKGFSIFFHQGSPNEDLHGPEFNADKKQFWKNYLHFYDEAGSFHAMRFLNTAHKKR